MVTVVFLLVLVEDTNCNHANRFPSPLNKASETMDVRSVQSELPTPNHTYKVSSKSLGLARIRKNKNSMVDGVTAEDIIE